MIASRTLRNISALVFLAAVVFGSSARVDADVCEEAMIEHCAISQQVFPPLYGYNCDSEVSCNVAEACCKDYCEPDEVDEELSNCEIGSGGGAAGVCVCD